MVLYREAVVDEIAQLLANQYHMLPRACKRVMKMVWFLMDIPDTQRREGLVHNKAHWKHEDLFLACMFFMKLDLRFTNVFEGNGERMLRKMLMSQRSLSMVLKALNGEVMRNAYEVMKMYVEWKYTVPENPSHPTIFRLPLSEVGRLLCEGWKQGGAPLVPPDTVILRESVRRKLNLHNKILTMMIWAPRLMGDKIKGEDSEDEDGPDDGPDQQPGEDSGDVEVEDAEDEVEPEDMDLDA